MANKQTAAPEAEEKQPKTPRSNGVTADAPEEAQVTAPPAQPEPAVEASAPSEQVSAKRRMPDNLRRFLLRVSGGKFYLPAAYRIVWFRDECPDWGVSTMLIEGGHEAGFATVQATITNPDGRVIASGIKTESKQDFPAGWVEKAETGAIARALAVAGFGTQFTPELDDDGNRLADSPQGRAMPMMHAPMMQTSLPPAAMAERPRGGEGRQPSAGPARPGGEVWPGPGQCPNCHAPEGKRHGKPCIA